MAPTIVTIRMTKARRSILPLAIFLLAITAPSPIALGALVPAVGSYEAKGTGDPAAYDVHGQVKRKGARRILSIQVKDRCGGLATFANVAVSRGTAGAPAFSAQVGSARIDGRWTSSTRIRGTVKTPCANSQAYVMRLTP